MGVKTTCAHSRTNESAKGNIHRLPKYSQPTYQHSTALATAATAGCQCNRKHYSTSGSSDIHARERGLTSSSVSAIVATSASVVTSAGVVAGASTLTMTSLVLRSPRNVALQAATTTGGSVVSVIP